MAVLFGKEFACREVHESSGDWVIYFTNYTELCAFREILETLWADVNLVSSSSRQSRKRNYFCTMILIELLFCRVNFQWSLYRPTTSFIGDAPTPARI